MRKVWTDRSRIEAYQRCNRLRYLEYHQDGTGITGKSKPLPLAVGGAVHKGLERLLLGHSEDDAVAHAVTELGLYRDALELPTEEALARSQPPAVPLPSDDARYINALAGSLGMSLEEAGLGGIVVEPAAPPSPKEFDEWLWREQSGLVEGMVRAYARRRLQPLLAEFEVLEVEREGEWLLSSWYQDPSAIADELWFMSRPDALLRERSTGNLYLLSFKTAASWDIRKERDAQHDMQGLSECVEVERRLGAGTRIMGIRYEYMLKGERWKDKDLSARFGFDVRHQRSPLVRQYAAVSEPKTRKADSAAYRTGDVCWSWDYIKEDGTAGTLSWQNWKSRPVDNVRAWIDKLDATEEAMSGYDSTTGLEPRALGWKSEAQTLGYTAQHPLDSIFLPPITIYRNDDELRDWIEQVEAQERRVAEGVAEVEAASDEGERRSSLNRLFPMTRRACEYPTTCAMSKVCWGGEDIRRAPLESGQYVRRVPNHEAEREASASAAKQDK